MTNITRNREELTSRIQTKRSSAKLIARVVTQSFSMLSTKFHEVLFVVRRCDVLGETWWSIFCSLKS